MKIYSNSTIIELVQFSPRLRSATKKLLIVLFCVSFRCFFGQTFADERTAIHHIHIANRVNDKNVYKKRKRALIDVCHVPCRTWSCVLACKWCTECTVYTTMVGLEVTKVLIRSNAANAFARYKQLNNKYTNIPHICHYGG